MTGLVLPTNRNLAARTILTAIERGWDASLTAFALEGVGLTGDVEATEAALHHLGILRGLQAGHIDARTVIDHLPTAHYDEVRAAAEAEHEGHLRDALDVLAVATVKRPAAVAS